MRQVYLTQIPRLEALQLFMKKTMIPHRREQIPVYDALHRITALPVLSNRTLPGTRLAAMDGIAVSAERTWGASDQNFLALRLGEDYLPVDTGEPIPEEMDAVIKWEDVQPETSETLSIMAPATFWQHVRAVGEDIVSGEEILPALHCVRPQDMGALLAGGIMEVTVLAAPKIVVIPTGDELVSPETPLAKGELPEFNSAMIKGFLTEWGAAPRIYPIMGDDPTGLTHMVQKALDEADIVIINAGSSAGSRDFTKAAIEALGEVLVHGIATRPGKPVILGTAVGKPLLGLPGYPVSARFNLEWFVQPLLRRYYGQSETGPPFTKAVLGRTVVSEPGVEEFIHLTVGWVNERYLAQPLRRGAGITMSMVKAHGLLVVPPECTGYPEGAEVRVALYLSEEELRRTLVAVGSHDLSLDLLGDFLKREDPGLTLSSAHVGSMGGILAIQKGQAHMAGVHLFDPETGAYNISYIRNMIPDQKLILVNLAYRMQGLMTAPGNPKQIQDLGDLVRPGVRFVNRQRGAGTRVLLDYLIRKNNFDVNRIYGYNHEEYSHLNVAAAVAADTADTGLGIMAGANAFRLDFIPVVEERYDLLMTKSFYQSPLGGLVLQILGSPEFIRMAEGLGGYSLRDAGKVFYEQ